MAIKISGNTVIDDSRNFINIADVTTIGVATANTFIGDGSQITNAPIPDMIEQPRNVSPADLTANVAQPVTLTSSTFYNLYGYNHANSQFQLSTSNTFATVDIDSGFIGANTTWEVPFANTSISTEYYWRVRYKDSNDNISEYSDITSFTTANTFIETPTLTVEGSPGSVPESPTLSTSAFSVFNGSDTHLNTDWQVEATANSTIVWESLANSSNKTSITVPAATLVADTEYIFRARHRGTDYGASEYDEVTVNTVASFAPTVLGESFGGGYYTGTICAAGTCYYLIVAPNATGCVGACRWKTTDTSTGICSEPDQLVNGHDNTYDYMNNTAHPAGNWTATRSIGGFTDWYLPAKDELDQMYINQGSMPAGEGYNTSGGGFYWSSSEGSFACMQRFDNGTQYNFVRTNCVCTRALRRIPF